VCERNEGGCSWCELREGSGGIDQCINGYSLMQLCKIWRNNSGWANLHIVCSGKEYDSKKISITNLLTNIYFPLIYIGNAIS
jgi:hypothetical protein